MKKMFESRARLAIYMETADLNRLTDLARSEGKVVVEWARGLLLEQLSDGEASHDTERAGATGELPVGGGGVAAPRGRRRSEGGGKPVGVSVAEPSGATNKFKDSLGAIDLIRRKVGHEPDGCIACANIRKMLRGADGD